MPGILCSLGSSWTRQNIVQRPPLLEPGQDPIERMAAQVKNGGEVAKALAYIRYLRRVE